MTLSVLGDPEGLNGYLRVVRHPPSLLKGAGQVHAPDVPVDTSTRVALDVAVAAIYDALDILIS